MLPLDPDAHTATELWVAFFARALVDSSARELNTESHEQLAGLCRGLLDGLAAAGRLQPGLDLAVEADLLHAILDGVALHAVTVPDTMTPDRIRRLLSHHLDRLVDHTVG